MGNPLHDRKLYGTATVGTKGQIVIPSDAREELNIQPGDRLYVVCGMDGAGLVLIKEEKLAEMIDKITAHAEAFRSLQRQTNDNKQ
ncbi:Transcriptional regulator, AbrB family [Candidatus Saccharibacteria bacterium RAAC3_TM7_1]|nr:Transcriptional regulator, AbrB family [Candidatus Saccharibacteria bacterium RAAC3_TM7_1]HCZ28251.1 AbrB/MazE/SpoVT family DNA-binding domain-containing protein [Candidatus Saccharibacteria bacterium]